MCYILNMHAVTQDTIDEFNGSSWLSIESLDYHKTRCNCLPYRGVARVGWLARRPCQQSLRGGKINTLNKQKIFSALNKFYIIKKNNWIKVVIFFKSVISDRSDHFHCSPQISRNRVTPLLPHEEPRVCEAWGSHKCDCAENCLRDLTPCCVAAVAASQDELCPVELIRPRTVSPLHRAFRIVNSASTHIFAVCQRTVTAALPLAVNV